MARACAWTATIVSAGMKTCGTSATQSCASMSLGAAPKAATLRSIAPCTCSEIVRRSVSGSRSRKRTPMKSWWRNQT